MRYLRPRPLPTVHWPLAASHLAPTLYLPGHVDSCVPDLCAPCVLGLVSRAVPHTS